MCRSNFASTSDLAALAHRLDALESSLIKSGALLPADLERYLKGTREQMANLQPTPTYGVPNIPAKAPPLGEQETVDDTEGAALTLEHLAFGRSRVDGGHSIPHFGMRYPSAMGRTAPSHQYHLAKVSTTLSPLNNFSPNHDITVRHASIGHGSSPLSLEERGAKIEQLLDLIGPTDIFDLFYKKTDVAMRALTKVLPSTERGEMLVKAYIERVDWLHRCEWSHHLSVDRADLPGIHIPTFLQSCADLWALPRENIVNEISLPWLSLYLAVCTVSRCHFSTPASNR